MTDDLADSHARNRAQYSAVAGNYATSESHAAGDDLAWFSGRARSFAPTRALDVACGGGFSTTALLEAGHHVVAVDVTPESLRAARAVVAPGVVGWVAGAAERLPFATSSVHLVGCRIAPHHFGDPARFVDEVVRVLAPAGALLLVDTTVPEDAGLAHWLDDVERLRDPSHQLSWSPQRWTAVLRGARLVVEEVTTYRKRHPLEPWLARADCTGERAEAVHERFRGAPAAARAAYAVEYHADGSPAAYTDTKVCLRASRSEP
jgi:SAM-dependent methyltransferase